VGAQVGQAEAPVLLRARDATQLDKLKWPYSVTVEGEMICVVVSGYELPGGLSAGRVDLLMRLPRGFPDVAPDMFWLNPALQTAMGSEIAGTQSIEDYLNRSWQRWSRHFAPLWRSGIDDMASLLAMIRRSLADAGGVEL
jgi:hypothetical protein